MSKIITEDINYCEISFEDLITDNCQEIRSLFNISPLKHPGSQDPLADHLSQGAAVDPLQSTVSNLQTSIPNLQNCVPDLQNSISNLHSSVVTIDSSLIEPQILLRASNINEIDDDKQVHSDVNGAIKVEGSATKSLVESDEENSSEWEDEEFYYKMVFIVNLEHKMGIGKVASQVGHAALGLYRLLKQDPEKYENSLLDWEETGEKKITLKCKNTSELLALRKEAESNELPSYMVQDAGRTCVPMGSITVMGLFGDEDAINDVTGHLKLL